MSSDMTKLQFYRWGQRRTTHLSCTCTRLSTGLLKAMRGILFCVCRWIPVPSLSCVFLFKLHIHMGESEGPTYKLMSRVRILLLVPCYYNETDSGSVKIFIFFFLFYSFYIFSFAPPNPFILSTCRLIRRPIPLAYNVTLPPSVQRYLTHLLVPLFAVFSLTS